MKEDQDEDVPKLGRGRTRLRLPMQQIVTIVMLIVALVAVLTLRRGCAQGVGNLFKAFEPPPDAAVRAVPPPLPLSPPAPHPPPTPTPAPTL